MSAIWHRILKLCIYIQIKWHFGGAICRTYDTLRRYFENLLSEVKSNFPHEINVELRHENFKNITLKAICQMKFISSFLKMAKIPSLIWLGITFMSIFQIKRVVSGENDFESKINTHWLYPYPNVLVEMKKLIRLKAYIPLFSYLGSQKAV